MGADRYRKDTSLSLVLITASISDLSVTYRWSTQPKQVMVDCGSGLGLLGLLLLHQVVDGALQDGVQTHNTLYIKHCDVCYTRNFYGESC